MTPREHEVIRAMARLHWLHGAYPTRSELGRELGITKVTAHLHLQRLAQARMVVIQPGRHRGASLTRKAIEELERQ